jgi:hypothetical protein
MTTTALAALIRLRTRTNSTTLTNADLLILANAIKEKIVLRALETDEDIFLVPTYLNLVLSQREYPMHSSILSRIKRVEAKLDGTNWIKLNEFDLTSHQQPVTPESNITYNFSNEEGHAQYDIMRKSIFLYSGTITSVTSGLRIWVNTWPADFISMVGTTDMSVDPTTTTHGFPKELHGILATGIVIDWKGSREKPLPLNEQEQNYDKDVERAIQSLKKGNYDREVTGKIPDNDGSQY